MTLHAFHDTCKGRDERDVFVVNRLWELVNDR